MISVFQTIWLQRNFNWLPSIKIWLACHPM